MPSLVGPSKKVLEDEPDSTRPQKIEEEFESAAPDQLERRKKQRATRPSLFHYELTRDSNTQMCVRCLTVVQLTGVVHRSNLMISDQLNKSLQTMRMDESEFELVAQDSSILHDSSFAAQERMYIEGVSGLPDREIARDLEAMGYDLECLTLDVQHAEPTGKATKRLVPSIPMNSGAMQLFRSAMDQDRFSL